jgi:hypothetical protein
MDELKWIKINNYNNYDIFLIDNQWFASSD